MAVAVPSAELVRSVSPESFWSGPVASDSLALPSLLTHPQAAPWRSVFGASLLGCRFEIPLLFGTDTAVAC